MGNNYMPKIEDQAVALKTRLAPMQVIFAEWLSLPASQRKPPTQKELARELAVTEETLTNWKQLVDLWDYIQTLERMHGKDLVPEAINVIERLMKSPNSKVALEAAKDVLSRWSDPRKTGHIVASIKDLYQKRDLVEEES